MPINKSASTSLIKGTEFQEPAASKETLYTTKRFSRLSLIRDGRQPASGVAPNALKQAVSQSLDLLYDVIESTGNIVDLSELRIYTEYDSNTDSWVIKTRIGEILI